VQGVFCTCVEGHLDMTAVQLLVDGFQATVDDAGTMLVSSFHDLQRVTSYDSEARVYYTEQSKPVMVHVASVEMLFSSRLIAMSIEVANIVLGSKLSGTTDRAGFEQRLAAAVAKR
jgi:hypothetical protein